jgi:hypothetical protein
LERRADAAQFEGADAGGALEAGMLGVTTAGAGGLTVTGFSQAESASDATKTEVSTKRFMVFPLK